jgi:hypothetical protein
MEKRDRERGHINISFYAPSDVDIHVYSTEKPERKKFNRFLLFMEVIDSLNVSKDKLLLSFEGVGERGALKVRDEAGDAL